MFRKSIFSRRWNLTLVFPPHFDINGSDMTHCLEKNIVRKKVRNCVRKMNNGLKKLSGISNSV